MRFWPIALMFALGAAVAAEPTGDTRVRLSKPAVRAELVAAVDGQLAAFRVEDWERAYGFAAQSFQGVVDLPQFVTLITRNYAVLWKNTRAEFGLPRDNGHVGIVPVRVFRGKDSEAYQWLMVYEGGHWRVTGVVPQRTEGGA